MEGLDHEDHEDDLDGDAHDQGLHSDPIEPPGKCNDGVGQPVQLAEQSARHSPVGCLGLEEAVQGDVIEVLKLLAKVVERPTRRRQPDTRDG